MVVLSIVGLFSILLAFIFLTIAYTTDKNSGSSAFHKLLATVVTIIAFVIVGFSLMAGGDASPMVSGTTLFIESISLAVIATIIASSTLDERARPLAYVILSILVGGLLFPLLQRWTDETGWLTQFGFFDSSGLGLIHLTMGAVAYISAWIVGPRLGKYNHNRVQALPSQSLFLAPIGILFAWLGWGALTLMALSVNPESHLDQFYRLGYNFFLIPSVSFISTYVFCYIYFKRLDMTLLYNGLLIGIVFASIAGAGLSTIGAVISGFIGGIVVVYVISWVDKKLKVDDPIGFVTVHGVGGFLALCMTVLFPEGGLNNAYAQFFNQLLANLMLIAIVGGVTVLVLKVTDITLGLRVSEEAESFGLDSSIYRLPNRYGSLSSMSVGKVPKKEALNLTDQTSLRPDKMELDVADLDNSATLAKLPTIRRFEILTNPDRLERLTQELNAIGVSGLNVANITGFGVQKGHTSFYRGVEVESHFLPKIKLETIVSAISTEDMLKAIRRALYTGHIGDGKIFISSIQDVVRVSTGATGKDALIYTQTE
ncbi:ammonium transporter [Amphibacillus cookii]|uniref:ammonium transporter n=1 Tax=Amphibacillus cookii TaxID=767787 RepID=UPI0019581C88|nr:ammonium transporter family protein [Amphibacillus cookii]MBM7542757.1 Amt family ammonium transporter [Amphibacillus cookii]